LASLLAAVATPLLLDPLRQLALCNGLSSSGPLALLAVLLVQLGAALDPEAGWLQRRRIRLAGACRLLSVVFLLLIPLQGWAAWQSLERIALFRKAVTGATSVAALQANLTTIQAPPLSLEHQERKLPDLKASLLGQLQNAEQQARRGSDLSQRAEWGRALAHGLDPWLDWD
jgi:hypothetical protein